jgi:hypothetical protein
MPVPTPNAQQLHRENILDLRFPVESFNAFCEPFSPEPLDLLDCDKNIRLPVGEMH